MSDDPEYARVAEICEKVAAKVEEKVETQCRLASMEDFYYDTGECKYWCVLDGKMYDKEAVNAMIPKSRWLLVTEARKRGLADPDPKGEDDDEDDDPGADGEPKKAKRGRPRNKLIEPHKVIQRVEFGHHVHGATFWPGQELIVKDWATNAAGYHKDPGSRLFNTYRPAPEYRGGDPAKAGLWIDHVKKLWPDPIEHEYFFKYMAHMVQHPDEKCNAALVLSGVQGIGKDAALTPVKYAIGEWNARGIDPDHVLEPFRPWLETVLLTIDEVRPNKDESRASAFYNQLKPLIAAPPDTSALNEKFMRVRYVRNILRVIMTTNDRYSLFIPKDDRRIFLMHSLAEPNWHVAEGKPDYFKELFEWFDLDGAKDHDESTGIAHIAAYLQTLNIADFNPKEPPNKTVAWNIVMGSWGEPDDLLEQAITALARQEQERVKWDEDRAEAMLKNLKWPPEKDKENPEKENKDATIQDDEPDPPKMPIIFGSELMKVKDFSEAYEIEIRAILQNTRKLTHRMQASGYDVIRNKTGKKWKFSKSKKKGDQKYLIESTYAFVLPSWKAEGTGGWDGLTKRIKDRARLLIARMEADDDDQAGLRQTSPSNVTYIRQ